MSASPADHQPTLPSTAAASPHLPSLGRPLPTSTYRVQLSAEFDFDAAAEIVPYLADLGVSHVYCSPWLAASPGSTHGYDVIDHGRVNPELGGEAGLARLRRACQEHGLGIVVDVVPNHMSVAAPESLNAAWWSVLRDGPDSPYARWFDIDWASRDNPGKVLLPVLGQPLAACLAAGEVKVDGDRVRYYDHEAPLRPGTEELPLPELLDAQHWRLCYWRVGGDELNYRRFFDITTMAAVRVEEPDVFAATHRTFLAHLADGTLDGLRIDHPDGLADPTGYAERLARETGGSWVVVEKILEPQESLPSEWPVAGTTGYDALNRLLGVFVDPAGAEPLTELYGQLTGEPTDWEQVATEAKRDAVRRVLPAEVERLAELVVSAAWSSASTRDLTRRALREALEELLAHVDVYRAYVTPGRAPSPQALAAVQRAAERAAAARPHRAEEIAVVAQLVLAGPAEVVVRFQQTCGPVMAKGVEDTAFYRYGRFVALNEVGGDPGRLGLSPAEFHEANLAAQREWPATMTTLSTHDTKRSEDVRARLALLSEDVTNWGKVANRLFGLGEKYGGNELDRGIRYFLLQNLVGAWPIEPERAAAYVEKASREAKRRTSWTEPDETYDETLREHVLGVLGDGGFVAALRGYAEPLAEAGWVNSLAQKLLQLTMPGVPDVYRGTELWDLSLVDPDNRRPVDFAERARLASTLSRGAPRVDASGAAKLHVVRTALRLRRQHPDWFGPDGGYEPLAATGAGAEHVLAFARAGRVVPVVPRLLIGLRRLGGWKDTALPLPPGEWTDVLTGRRHGSGPAYLLKLLRDFPVALLVAS